jgi:predicted RNA-binding protein YlxR (DUF448 family)
MLRARRTPRRTCVGCGEVQGKRELMRVVRTPAGEVLFDAGGKRSGRGAYVHGDSGCLDRALDGGRLPRALRCELSPDTRLRLRAEFAELVRLAELRSRVPQVHRASVPAPRVLQERQRRGLAGGGRP